MVTTGSPLAVELGPGLIENIYDGIQRPLEEIMKKAGANITRGIQVPALSREKKWDFTPVAKAGDKVIGGDVIGTVQESSVVLHKIMIPPKMSGTLESVAAAGSYTVEETVAVLKTDKGERVELTMVQKWPVRVGRPYKHKYPQDAPSVRPAHRGRHVPRGQGRHCGHPRPLRLGQDRHAASAGQVV